MNKLILGFCILVFAAKTATPADSERSIDNDSNLPGQSNYVGSVAYSGVIDSSGDFLELVGVPLWEPTEQSVAFINPDGTFWVMSDIDGRVRAGAWSLGHENRTCLLVGGIHEGCFETKKVNGKFRFYDPSSKMSFTEEIRNDLPLNFISNDQKDFYAIMTRHTASLDTGRGGDEHIYLKTDGRLFVVQPEGWIKTGGWWFTTDGKICDNIEAEPACYTIKHVSNESVVLIWHDHDEDVEISLAIERRPDQWPTRK